MIGPLHPGARHAYVATGFGGWGMSGGVLAGQLLAGLITGDEPPWAGLYDPRRLWSAVREAPALLRQQADVARHFVGDRLRTAHVDSVDRDPAGHRRGRARRRTPVRRLPRRGRHGPGGLGALYTPGLHRGVQRGGDDVGVPVPWLALRHRRQGAPGTGRPPAGAVRRPR